MRWTHTPLFLNNIRLSGQHRTLHILCDRHTGWFHNLVLFSSNTILKHGNVHIICCMLILSPLSIVLEITYLDLMVFYFQFLWDFHLIVHSGWTTSWSHQQLLKFYFIDDGHSGCGEMEFHLHFWRLKMLNFFFIIGHSEKFICPLIKRFTCFSVFVKTHVAS